MRRFEARDPRLLSASKECEKIRELCACVPPPLIWIACRRAFNRVVDDTELLFRARTDATASDPSAALDAWTYTAGSSSLF
jgi:hypothetical protein